MASIHIFNNNAIDTALLDGGSWSTELPLEFMREQRPTLKARSIDTQLSSTKFRLQLSAPLTSMGIQFISTNLSNAARYKITWYSDNTFTVATGTTDWQSVGTTIDWSDTGNWLDWLDPDFWLGSAAFIDPDNQGRDIRHRFDPPQVLQYLIVEIDDVSNLDGYVDIGYLYVGRAFVPSINIAYEPVFKRLTRTTSQESAGGGATFNRRGSQKSLSVSFAQLPSMEVLGDLDDIVQIHDIDKPVFVDLDPENTDTGRKTAFLARMVQLPENRLIAVFFDDDVGAAVGFEFVQVL